MTTMNDPDSNSKRSGNGGAKRPGRVRRLRNVVASTVRELRLPSLARELLDVPPTPAAIMAAVAHLRRAWGNPVWSADLGCLEEAVTRALGSPGPFLDCGAGLSTVVLAAIAARQGTVVWSLEQDAEWTRIMRRRLAAARLPNVRLLHAPLAVIDGRAWYDFTADDLPRHFPLVFCDGPAVWQAPWPEDVYLAWRSALVPELRRRSVTFDTIVLDDAQDARCPALLDAWRGFGLETEIVTTPHGRHVVVMSPDNSRPSGGAEVREAQPC